MADTPLNKVLSRLKDVKRLGNGGYQAHCPVHGDEHASLSVSEDGPGGKVLLHCHAQECGYDDIMAALNLDKRDGFPDDKPSGTTRAKGIKPVGEIVATYDYRDAAGELLYQSVRYKPKDFRQRQPDGQGGWIWNLNSVQRVLYRLPELLVAVKAGKTACVVEGEKDADNLSKIGVAATTNCGGAGKWQPGYSEVLRGAKVVILPDNDNPGRVHAQSVALSLRGIAASIKVLELPDLPSKGDVSDWLERGGTREQLGKLVSEAPEWVPQVDSPQRRFTDDGLADLLVSQHGRDLRYCYPWASWLVWDNALWTKDPTGRVDHLAKDAVLKLYAAAAETRDNDEREAILKLAKRGLSTNGRKAMLDWARFASGIPVMPDELDADPYLLNCLNGAVSLEDGSLQPPSREHLCTRICNAMYDPDAKAPTWLAFLDRVMCGDAELISFLQRVAGYSLTGDTSEHVMFFLFGSGRNGKSTFINALQFVMGDYAGTVRPEALLEQRSAANQSNDIAALKGARLVSTVEIAEGRRLAEGLIKQLVGGDRISARFLYGEFFEFTPQFKLWMVANAKPIIHGTNAAIWERIHLIPWEAYIPPEERDKHLGEKLQAEADGILAWAVQGCLDWQQHGLAVPARVKAATSEYRSEMDVLAAFIEECCVAADPGTGDVPRVKVADLYKAYTKWCEDNVEKPISKNAVSRRMGERGIEIHRGTGGVRYWVGMGLVHEGPYGGPQRQLPEGRERE